MSTTALWPPRASAFSPLDCLQRVDNGLFATPIADVRGNVCLSELPSAEVGQERSIRVAAQFARKQPFG
jgi:hypothetical protein